MIDVFPALFDNYFIKIVFLIHASLWSIANIANASTFTVVTYSSYNLLFLMIVLLAILVDDNVNIILVATAFDAICIVLDIILLITIGNTATGLFAILIITVNLLCRPLSTILLLKNYSARAGVEDPTGGLLEVNVQAVTVPRARSAYQNIDEPNQTLP